jgi:hypothetical protein
LVFNEATDQGKVKDKNILNFPYSGYQDMEPAMEDTPQIEVSPSLDKTKSSSINNAKKSVKIQKLKDKIEEYKVLERVIKSRYENLTKNVVETRAYFDKLALMYVK